MFMNIEKSNKNLMRAYQGMYWSGSLDQFPICTFKHSVSFKKYHREKNPQNFDPCKKRDVSPVHFTFTTSWKNIANSSWIKDRVNKDLQKGNKKTDKIGRAKCILHNYQWDRRVILASHFSQPSRHRSNTAVRWHRKNWKH